MMKMKIIFGVVVVFWMVVVAACLIDIASSMRAEVTQGIGVTVYPPHSAKSWAR
jgi:hypothetical protein